MKEANAASLVYLSAYISIVVTKSSHFGRELVNN